MTMSEKLFEDWDDFERTIDELADKGILERYINGDGEESIKLTEKGIKYAEFLRDEKC